MRRFTSSSKLLLSGSGSGTEVVHIVALWSGAGLRRKNALLCNADGMGNIRKEELYQASAVLKVPLQQVKILDHPDLQDGFGKVWRCDLLARIIEEEILNHAIDLIITFDNYGVSGHCNHRDVNQGIRKLLRATAERDLEAWELVSTNILRKYSGPVDIWLSLMYAMYHKKGQLHCMLNEHPRKSYIAMAQHMSQWIWYVPQAFCAVFQLYLCEYAEEDQLVGAWDRIHWTKNPGIRSYFDEKQPFGKFGILWDFDEAVIAMGSSSSWQTAPSKSIYEDSIKSFDEAIVPQFGAFSFTPKL
ncbi:unnamed protein product [Camellia sinensis]